MRPEKRRRGRYIRRTRARFRTLWIAEREAAEAIHRMIDALMVFGRALRGGTDA